MLILFDLDDTLVDHGSAVRLAVERMHAEWNVNGSVAAFVERWGEIHDRHYPRFLSGELTYPDLRRLRLREAVSYDLADAEADHMFELYMLAYEENWTLFPDVLDCLDGLVGQRLGLITNGPSGEQRRKLERLGIAERFDHVIISSECGYAKPDPEIYWRACEEARADRVGTPYIGDHLDIDVRGALSAGLRGIWLNRNSGARPSQHGDVLHSLSDVRPVLAIGQQSSHR